MSRESVTDVMRKAADFLPTQLAEEMSHAVSRVSELISADEEFDRCRHALMNGPHTAGIIREMGKASIRRTTALARCKELEHTDGR